MIPVFIAVPSCVGSERPRIHAGDVVFMYSASDPSQYDAYSGTVVGWGGRPRTRDQRDIEAFRGRVAEAHRRKMRYCASVDFLVDFRGFIDFRPETFMDAVCRDLDGNPLHVPWLWDHEYKGHPAYWFCTNNPNYQAYLRDQVERVCMAPIDGLHIDDYSGTSACSAYNGGCFCPYCMDGFRRYLKDRFSEKELREMGIEQVEKFDYRRFLKERGITAEQFRRESWRCPLGDLFQDFQNQQMKEVVGEIFEYAERLRGRRLVRSVNSSASSPRTLIVAPLIDYFCGEVPHHASTAEVPVEPVFVFRMVEALDRRQTATAAGHDWAWIKANGKPGLVRTWIAQAYAFGSTFMVPHRQWCYTRELGTHWWYGRPEDFAHIYRFVREHAHLLDEYISLADTALIYSNANFSEVRDAALKLAEANIPYVILAAGDESLPYRITSEMIEPYDYLIAGSKPLPDGQEEILQTANAKIVRWEGLDKLPDKMKGRITVDGSDPVRISIRHNPCSSDSPLVCHILNLNYDFEMDDIRPADVTVTIGESILKRSGLDVRFGMIHMIGGKSARLPITKVDEGVKFEIKGLGLWAIVELKGGRI